LLLWLGCSSGSSSATSNAHAPDQDSGSGTSSSSGFGFEATGVLEAAPRQNVTLTILDPSSEDVSVFLDGSYADASLSSGTTTAANGRASVTLHAPSQMATFSVHAQTASGKTARLDVAVSAGGFASITVTASYEGDRTVGPVIGSVFLGTSCTQLSSAPLTDGSPMVVASIDIPFTISSIPAGTPVAVVNRIGHYASACVDVPALTATVTQHVSTSLYDVPMALADADLDAQFTLDATSATSSGWNAMLTAGATDASNAFFASGNEAGDLLDAMQAATPGGSNGPSGVQFASGRQSQNWSSTTSSWLASHTPSLHARAVTWLSDAAPNAFGNLTAHIGGGPSAGLAAVTLSTFANIDAKSAGLSSSVPFGFVADSTDVVHLSGSVLISPSNLIAASADANAAAAVSGATDVPSALATQIDCAGLAASLVGSGSCYSGCDSGCTGQLCASALSALWQSAKDASSNASHLTTIDLAASAQAKVGDEAEPISFSGSWTGNVRATSGAFSVGGATTATTP
jgi:hypothetical protein